MIRAEGCSDELRVVLRLCDWCGKPANVVRPVRRPLPDDEWLPSLAYEIVFIPEDGCWYVSMWQRVCLDRCGP